MQLYPNSKIEVTPVRVLLLGIPFFIVMPLVMLMWQQGWRDGLQSGLLMAALFYGTLIAAPTIIYIGVKWLLRFQVVKRSIEVCGIFMGYTLITAALAAVFVVIGWGIWIVCSSLHLPRWFVSVVIPIVCIGVAYMRQNALKQNKILEQQQEILNRMNELR